MQRYSVAEAKARFSEVLAKVEAGRDVVITRRGEPIARISGVEGARRPLNLNAIDAFRNSLPAQQQAAAELLRRLRDEKY
ncbi:MAG: type II toxin-antitoxin system prevent-host-death family antitoxin [Steroidobacteraceae bacterium]